MLFYFLLETESDLSPSMRTISCACFWDRASTLSLASLNFARGVQGVRCIAESKRITIVQDTRITITGLKRIEERSKIRYG
jgi:hypothetical protein